MSRVRTDNVFGTVTDAPLTDSATTLNSAGLANLATIASPDYAVITLDPNRVDGAPEVIYVTAHTGAATSATILRAQEGTSAREHAAGTEWVHAPTARDFALGEIGYAEVMADQGSITTIVDLTSLTATVTVAAGRRIRISAGCRHSNSGANSNVLYIREGSTTLQTASLIGSTSTQFLNGAVVITPTAGAHTYKLSAETGGGTMTMRASSTSPAFILVEDIGPVRTAQPS